jgi:putative ABC transport system permease protein
MAEHSPYRPAFRPGFGNASDAEVDAELEAHIQMRVEDLVRRGMRRDDAERQARERFGDFETARALLHSGARRREATLRKRDWFGAVVADLRFAFRQMRRTPGFSAVTGLTLAVAIGLTTATFTLVERTILRPLPFPGEDRLVALGSIDSTGARIPVTSAANWLDWRGATTLDATGVAQSRRINLIGDEGGLRVAAQIVSADYLRVLRPRFLLGRSFTADETDSGIGAVVVSERLWRSLMRGDSMLASPLHGSARNYTVVGVIAQGSEYPAGTDMWVATSFAPNRDTGRNNINWSAIARIREGATARAASEELDRIAARIRQADPSALYSHGVDVTPLRDHVVAGGRRMLFLLLGAVGFVLLIACANVSAANLSRGIARRRELAVRTAIGAGRGRIVQQLLVEHLLVGLLAGAAGLAIAAVALRTVTVRWGARIPRIEEVQVDLTTLLFAIGTGIAAGVASGVIPALLGSRASLASLMAAGGRGAAGGGRNLPGSLLVGTQVALAVVLVTGTALLVRSFTSLVGRELGFSTNVATIDAVLNAPRFRADTNLAYAYWDRLTEQLKTIPGVTNVGVANWTPLDRSGTGFIEVEGLAAPGIGAGYRAVSEDYLPALGVSLLRGRALSSSDRLGTERVALVNRAMADRYWPGQDPIGRRIRALSMEPSFDRRTPAWIRVVGVVGDLRHHGFAADVAPEMYVSYRQVPLWAFGMTAVVRTTGPIDHSLPLIKARADDADRTVPVDVSTMERRLTDQLMPRRMAISLLTAFGGIALLLSALGVYGMLAYAVSRRHRELAIRSALGATGGNLLRLVLTSAMRVVGGGLVIGTLLALAVSKLLQNQLVEVSPTDPAALATAIVILAVVAAGAAAIPGLRATRADPIIAMRAE